MIARAVSSRSRLKIFAPFATLVVLAALWTVFWHLAARKAEAAVAAWIEREAGAGRVYTCSQLMTGGYRSASSSAARAQRSNCACFKRRS
jgi:hypothetical protein